MARFYTHVVRALLVTLSVIFTMQTWAADTTPQELYWVDTQTGDTLFTVADIVRFDWERQIFEVSPERATELLALPVAQYRDFAVKDRDGVIYLGRFYRSVSNVAYDGTTIMIDQGPTKKMPSPPYFAISGGYPTGGGAREKERFADRLYKALDKAGLLTAIPDQEIPIQPVWSGHTWVGGEQVVKASAILFPGTFRIGKDAYAHLLLYKGQRFDFPFDKLQIAVTCISGENKFSVTQQVLAIDPPLLDNGIYVCRFRPWEGIQAPREGDDANTPVKAMAITVARYTKDAENENRGGTVVMAVTVDAAGQPLDYSYVTHSGSDDLDKSALRALQRWTFEPAKINGTAATGVIKVQIRFAEGKVEQKILPPDPVKVVANPGPLELTFTITALKKVGNDFTQVGSWKLPPRTVTLLPAQAEQGK